MKPEWQQAIYTADLKKINELLTNNIDVNSKDKYGQTAIMNAARYGYHDVIQTLLVHGADPDITAKYNLSALMIAVLNNHVDSVRVLVNSGCDLDIQGGKEAIGFYQKTALDLANIQKNQEIIDILTKAQQAE